VDQIATRRLRFVKYRGSLHGADEYPFLIDETGIYLMPVTSLGLDYAVTNERVSSGIPRLDNMLDGGYYRGSSILISGTAGTGKSSLAAHFATPPAAGASAAYISPTRSPRPRSSATCAPSGWIWNLGSSRGC
jgi:circadian clock protein KaiC